MDKDNSNDFVQLQVQKEVSRLFKVFLETIESLQLDHKIFISKLEEIDPELVNLDYFTQEKYDHLRKRVLDSGNETSRSLLSFLEFYDFYINKDKVNHALNQRKIVKKYTSSYPIIVE
jgi:hypothetical protein